MSTTTITSRLDTDTATSLKAFARELGLTLNGYVSAVLTQSLRDRRVVLSDELVPNESLLAAVAEAEENYKSGKNYVRTNGKAEALAYLDSLMVES
jgi:antitoxin component of RelBE/YafQ-DinJ toxin-antitoxin module